MEIDTHNAAAQDKDFADAPPWTDDAGMLSPTSKATMDSERRSLTSPSQRIVHRRWTEPEDDHRSRASLRSSVSKGNLSEGGLSTAPSEREAPKAQPPGAVGEFKEFIRACQDVEKYLESFTHQVQKLGSAFGLVKASRELHNNLSSVRSFFEEHAQTLGLLLNKIKTAKSPKQAKKRKKRRGTTSGRSNSSISGDSTDNFIGALNRLARSVNRFTSAILDFDDYNDDEGNKALQDFEIELRVLSGGLEFFSVDGESHELRRFVTARASSLRAHLDNLSEALNRFESIGIPCISFSQKRSSKMLLNAATVATFFAGVAATTLQYSVEMDDSVYKNTTNTLWFVSLVLSIGAAITGMLAMTWRLAVFSSPKRHLPLYIRFWFRSGYLVLLIASVIAFLVGLVVYVLDTMPKYAFWIVLASTVFCTLGLAAVSALFLKERYSFSQVRNELREELNPVNWSRIYEQADEHWWYWLRYHLFDQLREKRRMLVRQYTSDSASLDPNRKSFNVKDVLRLTIRFLRFGGKSHRRRSEDSEAALDSAISEVKPREPWRKTSRKAASIQHRPSHNRAQRDGIRQPQSSGDDIMTHWYNGQLKQLGLSLCAPVNTRAVHLQFSPDGHWLVVCYKYECCAFDVERSFDYHATLRHHARNAKQVEWCPSGARLITRTSDSVKVWSVDEEDRFQFEKTVYFDGVEEISDIQWLNDNEFLAIADESHFFRVNVSEDPPTKTMYDPEPENSLLEIYYLYTLPDSDLVMIVGARNIEDLEEDKAIDCIIVYEMKATEIETRSHTSQSTWATYRDYTEGRGIIRRRIPLLNELESLSFGTYVDSEARRRRMVISYSDKPPEIWTVTLQNERIHMSLEKELVNRMDPGEKQDEEAEWGEAFLIGPAQSVVACAEDGMMYFWDVEQSAHEQFHRTKIITEDEEVEELPLISWIGNHAESIVPTMATAGKGLSLKIWAPLRNATIDSAADQIHGPMDDGLVLAARSDSNGATRLVAPSDSGLGQVSPKSTNTHTQTHTSPPFPTITAPTADSYAHSLLTPAPPSNLDLPYLSPPALLSPSAAEDNDNVDSLDDKSSHLAPGSQYCSSPESSMKDEDVIAGTVNDDR